MSSNYTGNPTATEPPAGQPGLFTDLILALPADGDTLNVSSILQPLKALADWLAWVQSTLGDLRGIAVWKSTNTYPEGAVVQDPGDWHIYWSTTSNSNKQPHLYSNSLWYRMDWSQQDLANAGTQAAASLSGAGISCSYGASVGAIYQLKCANAAMSMITFSVANVAAGGYTDVDLTGCVCKFTTAIFTAVGTAQGAPGYSPSSVSLVKSSGGNINVLRVYNSGITTVTADVVLWGY